MSEIDPELRDKIIETHTMMQVVVKDADEHKRVTNARLREANKKLDDHRKEVKTTFALHRYDIDQGKSFRVQVVTYASIAAGSIAFFSDPVVGGIKRLFGV